MVKTTRKIKKYELFPKTIQYASTHYKEFRIVGIEFIETLSDSYYKMEIKDGDFKIVLIFNSYGEFLRED